jgi:ribosomal-protein-alanine N-acetyltransferase
MITPNFNPFPVLETQRLRLRRPLLADAADIFEIRSDKEVMRYIPRPLATSLEDVYAFLNLLESFVVKSERINWAIEWKETGKVVGLGGYVHIKPEHSRAEVGYSIARAWHRKGIMREALQAILAYGFSELELHSVEAIIDEDNIASGNVLEDAGFRKEARFIEDFFYNDQYRNSVHYGLLQREWTALKRNAEPAEIIGNK